MAARGEAAVRSDAVVFQTSLHPASVAGALGLAGFIGFVGMLIIRHNDLPASTDLRIVLGCAALGAVVLLGPVLRWRRSLLLVAPGHLHLELGTWRRRTTDIALRDIRSVDVRSTTAGRHLDFGTVTVAAGDDTVIVIHHVRAPLMLRDALRRAGGRR